MGKKETGDDLLNSHLIKNTCFGWGRIVGNYCLYTTGNREENRNTPGRIVIEVEMCKNMTEDIIKCLKESKSKRKWNEAIMAKGIKSEEGNREDTREISKQLITVKPKNLE